MSEVKNALRNIVGQEYPYKGRILDLRIDTVLFPSGSRKVREVVEHKPAVALIAVDNEGKMILVSQYRHAVDAEILEIPAGIIEEGEKPEYTAVRELQEETGLKPAKVEHLADFWTSPGYSTELIYLYFVSDFTNSKLPEDDDEFIKVKRFTSQEIADMIRSGKIRDGKTIMAYYWYEAWKARK
jgi:ADP-ribose pyrophosphatase